MAFTASDLAAAASFKRDCTNQMRAINAAPQGSRERANRTADLRYEMANGTSLTTVWVSRDGLKVAA